MTSGQDDSKTLRSRQTVVTVIGAALVVVGSGVFSQSLYQGWNWGIRAVAVLLVVEGIDCLYSGLTGRNGATPILFVFWQWF